MKKIIPIILVLGAVLCTAANAQDSIIVQAHPSYNDVNKVHHLFFGKNYRKEWALPSKVPVFKISEMKGGLTPTQLGGGHQTHSLRLKDKEGREWVLRSIEKYPEVLIPEALRKTFAKDWVDDNMSAQHPYSALVVPILAEAAGVPHTNPVIGWVAPDPALGEYAKTFENTLCLFEEREPEGKSDNTLKMFANLDEDNDNTVNAEAFLKASLLDIVIGDWDRHTDQWRWRPEKTEKGKEYFAIPRDRDQVFYVNQGLFPRIASRSWLLPFLQGFDTDIENINTYLWESRLMSSRILNELSYQDWMRITRELVSVIPDPVLEKALKRLPESSWQAGQAELLHKMKQRRDNLEKEMDTFYRFLNKIIDIRVSDKNEQVVLSDGPGSQLRVTIHKLSNKGNTAQQLFSRDIDPGVTSEVRIFLAKGADSVRIDTRNAEIKIRIIGGEGPKTYQVENAGRKVLVYEKLNSATFSDPAGRLRIHRSDDSLNTAIVPSNRYTINMPLVDAGFNRDDGILFGLGIKHSHPGFRKFPYASIQQITASHSFSTSAFRIKYSGQWMSISGRADLITSAVVYGPNNTMNFFGRGNETAFNKTGDYKTFYRTRYNLFQFDPALRWKNSKGFSFTAGPSLQYYHLNSKDNAGRITANSSLVGSYDSLSINRPKVHAGIVLSLVNETRSNKVLPSSGTYMSLKLQGYKGLNGASRSFVQLMPSFSVYKSLTRDSALVISDRIGGGITAGKTAFYQSMFLGGHDNLLGYRQYRFAGRHMLYNNVELRLRVAELASYILPGELGISAFFDTGRVWEKNEKSEKWHTGAGGGIYLAPARYAIIQYVQGHSEEGWYPYIKLSTRF